MADTIKLPAGNKATMPELPDRAPAFVRDERALYVGTPDGNLKLCSADTEGKVTALETALQELNTDMDRKLTATAAAAQAELEAEAELAAVVASFNALIAALKAGGIMEN